jgi:EmrB/QacA subfamily drug resistance transporter
MRETEMQTTAVLEQDRPGPTPATRSEDGSPGWWPLVVVASAHLMAVLDTTVMFVALPATQKSLGLGVSTREWVVTAYTLAFGGLLLLGGRLADRFGAKTTLMAGVIGFACASAIGGASVDATMLIAARAIQGAFAAVLVSSTKSVLVTVYKGERERARAIGIFTATLTGGLAAGLVIGGVLTSELGWRWCLYVNVLLSLVTVFGAPRVLPATPARREVSIDAPSVVLACAGMLGLVYGFGEVSSAGWGSIEVVGSLVGAFVMLVVFVLRQRSEEHPLLPLRVVRERNRAGALLAMVFNSLSTFGMLLILTYQLQTVMRFTALRTGVALVPFAVCAAVGSALLSPRLARRFAPRTLITAGILLSAAGLVPLVVISRTSGYLPLILVAEIVEGIGTGIAGPAILQTALRSVDTRETGAASAASSAAGQLGSSIGAALLNSIAATATAGYLAGNPASGITTAVVHGFSVAMGWGAGLLVVSVIPVVFLVNARAKTS